MMGNFADLTDALTEELSAMARGVISNEYTHRVHPSYITKKVGRADFLRMVGAQSLYFRVFPLTEMSADHPCHEVIKLCNEAARVSYWFDL